MESEKSGKGKGAEGVLKSVEIPQGVSASIDGAGMLSVKGPKGEVHRSVSSLGVSVSVEAGMITVKSVRSTKNLRKVAGSFNAHIRNMVVGVTEGYSRKMKVCSGHFPMTVSVSGNELMIKNFVGEKMPRRLRLPVGVGVKVKGGDVELESCDKEMIGNVMSAIEKLCGRPAFDKRVFQDNVVRVSEAD